MVQKLTKMLAIAVICMVLMTGCMEPDVLISEECIKWERDIAYACYVTEVATNNFGGVIKTDEYFVFATIGKNGTIEEHKDLIGYGYKEAHPISVGEKDKVVYWQWKRVYDCGTYFSDVGYRFEFTKETLKDIRNSSKSQ